MFRRVLSAALVSAAMVVAGPALAGPGGGGGGGGHGGGAAAGAGIGARGGMGAGMGGVFDRGGMSGRFGAGAGVDINGNATRINSHASPNSSFNRGTTTTSSTIRGNAFGRSSVQSSALPGLTTGLTVRTNTGITLGNVSRIVTDRNGNIVAVLVTTSNGRTIRLAPSLLSMNGNILVATNRARAVNSQGVFNASPNGIAHASANSVLNRGAVAPTLLPGLATGLTVINANNVNIGTVSRVVTDANGNIRLVIVTNTSTGQSFRLMPTTLTINGNVVTTTSVVGG